MDGTAFPDQLRAEIMHEEVITTHASQSCERQMIILTNKNQYFLQVSYNDITLFDARASTSSSRSEPPILMQN